MTTTLVTTTIHVPALLEAYANNARAHGHHGLRMIVVGDRKTPAAAAEFCARIDQQLPCEYLDVAAQQRWLAAYPELDAWLPYDCIQRRNVGLLKAYADGAEVIITIDDDNFLTAGDFVGEHALCGQSATLPTVASSSGWFNVCQTLATDDNVPIYHRGFPHQERWAERKQFVTQAPSTQRVVVNAGFWLDDPDIGALDRMQRQVVVRGHQGDVPERFLLAPGTWSPFNSQNTALWAEALPCYFLSPHVGRYDDIWASYIMNRVLDHLGGAVAFGPPWVRQARNPHDLWRDLEQERAGMVLTDAFCRALRAVPLQAGDWHGCAEEIAHALPRQWILAGEQAERFGALREQYLGGLSVWQRAVAQAADARRSARGAKRQHGGALGRRKRPPASRAGTPLSPVLAHSSGA